MYRSEKNEDQSMPIMPNKRQSRQVTHLLTGLLAGLLWFGSAAAQIDRSGEGRGFDLRLRQNQSDRQWRSADPLTRQRREADDLRQRQRIENQTASQRRDPMPAPGRLDQGRERSALDYDLDLERSREESPPSIERPEVDRELLRDLDKR
jgi:hypothetical protein